MLIEYITVLESQIRHSCLRTNVDISLRSITFLVIITIGFYDIYDKKDYNQDNYS